MFVGACLIPLLFVGFCAYARDLIAASLHQRLITPVSFYGYKRGAASVVGVTYSLAIVSALISFHTAAQLSSKEIACPAQLSVVVHKAVLTKRDTVSDGVDKIGNNVCTEFMRAKCLDHASFNMPQVSPDECKSKTHGNFDGSWQLILQLPKALHNGSFFVQGVSRSFLRIPGAESETGTAASYHQLQKSLRKCLESSECKYVSCHDGMLHTDEYFYAGKSGPCAYLKPDLFKLSGYTVYLNYTGLCSRPQQLQTRDFYEVAKLAKSRVQSSFSIAYTPTSQFSISPAHASWICRGIPTIVPMTGHVVAVPASSA
ncbi:hypothetical protein X943_001459 [Babesia divergens]|uniref:Uncharacterized protein n=1 Tax=Babesia divergens TaxID=32595 RepID=A0AAD9GHC4_BABDI|nr:hypothetical protein X943_001459 [Babesia divergens]